VFAGPYRFVRNPMSTGAVAVLTSAASYGGSARLMAYSLLFAACAHFLAVGLEEPRLRRAVARL
jgi:protein-S-isoprenylcysteine O-methyltransferase Ste14